MNQFSKQLKKLRLSLGLRQKDIADYLGVTPTAVSDYESGKRIPSLDSIINIANRYNVSLPWLITGTGDIDNDAHAREAGDSIEIPIYAEISAGGGIEAEDIEPARHVAVSKSQLAGYPGPFYAFEVSGVSMEPEMRSGDIIVVAGWDYSFDYNGQLCAFRSVDGLLVKRLFYDTTAKCLYLIPINPANPITKYDENSADLTLIGVVVVLMRNYTKGDKS